MIPEKKLVADKKIRVPTPLWGALKDQAKREGVPIWVVLHRAFTAYISRYRSHYTRDVDAIDKAAWYAFKLAATIGRLYIDQGQETLELLNKVIEQIKDRIGIDTRPLEAAIGAFLDNPTQKTRALLSGTTKKTIAEIIDQLLYKAQDQKQQEQQQHSSGEAEK